MRVLSCFIFINSFVFNTEQMMGALWIYLGGVGSSCLTQLPSKHNQAMGQGLGHLSYFEKIRV